MTGQASKLVHWITTGDFRRSAWWDGFFWGAFWGAVLSLVVVAVFA